MDKADGSYVFGDSEFEDKMERKIKALIPVKKPDGFKIPGIQLNTGNHVITPDYRATCALSCSLLYQIFVAPRGAKKEDKIKVLPNLSNFGPRPRRPIILYEVESSGECRAVREAATGR